MLIKELDEYFIKYYFYCFIGVLHHWLSFIPVTNCACWIYDSISDADSSRAASNTKKAGWLATYLWKESLIWKFMSAYLLRAKIAFDTMELDQTEALLAKCQSLAEAEKLTTIINLIQKDQNLLTQRWEQIASLIAIDKPLSVTEQKELLKIYIGQALESLKSKKDLTNWCNINKLIA